MQRTEPMTIAHQRSDFIYHMSQDDRQEEWGETDNRSEVRLTRRVRWDWQEEWGETDKTMAEEFQNEM